MTADLTPAPDLGARLDELERLHAAWQVGGWDGFEAGLKLPHAVPRLVAAVRAVYDLCGAAETVREHNRRTFGLDSPPARIGTQEIRDALTAALAAVRPSPDSEAVARDAGLVAVRNMPFDWYCPSDERRPRVDCRECVAEVALDAALGTGDREGGR